MRRRFGFARALTGGFLLALAACMNNVDPKVTPSKVPAVRPPLQSRAILLLPRSFETYTSQSSQGINSYTYHLGESAADALTDLIKNSFQQAETRRVSDVESVQYLTAPADTSVADLLLVPYFERGGYSQRALDIVANVRLRLDVRSYKSGAMYSWTATGRTARAISSLKGLTGNALEQALRAVGDSLRAHRSDLEAGAGS
jgi:hypothetical protein